MKRFFLSACMVLSLFMEKSYAQDRLPMYLTNYTYGTNKGMVSAILLEDGTAARKVRLSGKDASLFKVVNGNILNVKPEVLKKRPQVLTVDISVEKEGQIITESFMIARNDFQTNKVIAHRGAWKTSALPHNSIASLQKAIALKCAGSEFDVQLSADSILYVNHDADIQGHTIEKTDASALDDIRLSNGETLPRLKEYIEAGIGQNQTKLILELKPSVLSGERGILLAHKVLDMVRQLRAEAWVDYISFDYNICKEIAQLAPYAKVAYLRSDKAPAVLKADHINGFDYHFSVLRKNPQWIAEARELKIETNSWTVNNTDDMDWLLTQRLDLITTDEPEILLQRTGK